MKTYTINLSEENLKELIYITLMQAMDADAHGRTLLVDRRIKLMDYLESIQAAQ